ncbi:hypothetical protein [Arthrobacter sp. SX1312]|uniref:hypothetical protein n=1 Tax=Arthrobacter sp. SX1312 TaxID=2058896 RepID=UPI0011AFDE8C|nr:hypothetical protein [Arthrobacter sp. SX1312]
MCSLHHEVDRRVAEPLAASLDRIGHLVTSVVPPGYERYVRVLNPVAIDDGSVIRWSDIMERNGLEPSPWMQWDELKAHPDAVLPAGNAEPAMGDPHPSLAGALIRELHVDEGRHYFASWTGYAEGSAPPIIEFSPSRREMALYSGVLIDAEGSVVVPTTDTGRVPTYWWPGDLQWCVGQDLYARSLIVGCDLPTAGRILAAEDLDSHLIRESDMVPSEDF